MDLGPASIPELDLADAIGSALGLQGLADGLAGQPGELGVVGLGLQGVSLDAEHAGEGGIGGHQPALGVPAGEGRGHDLEGLKEGFRRGLALGAGGRAARAPACAPPSDPEAAGAGQGPQRAGHHHHFGKGRALRHRHGAGEGGCTQSSCT